MASNGFRSWKPAKYAQADLHAVRSVAAGTATEDQQRRAIKWIVETACMTYEPAFQPDHARETDFALGRAFVGQQIVKMINMPADVLDKLWSDKQ